MEIIAETVQFLGGRNEGGGDFGGGAGGSGGPSAPTYMPPAGNEPDFGSSGPDDDIPF